MVEINYDRKRPAALLDLSSLSELASWERNNDAATLRIGAGVCYTTILRELVDDCPGLAMAARTVGSPQIRRRGTVGGNLATASPAGDLHPVLLAVRAKVEVASLRGARIMAIDDFFTGPKQNALEPDELIRAVIVPVAQGPQQFAKLGSRNAMVIAAVSFALSLDPLQRRVGVGIGAAGPTPLRAGAAEQFAGAALGRCGWSAAAPDDTTLQRFGELAAAATSPIDDVRDSAAHRRHAVSVLARRCLGWAWSELRQHS